MSLTSDVTLDAKIPPGPLQDKWDTYKEHVRLVNPNNKRPSSAIG
jgi:succinate dehydrogenase / fumarate reductase flavoprotein subunit